MWNVKNFPEISSEPQAQLLEEDMALCLLVPLCMETSSQTLLSAAEAKTAALLGTHARSSPGHHGAVYHPVGNHKTSKYY